LGPFPSGLCRRASLRADLGNRFSEVLQEHVDLAVEPRTSRHVASLPSSRHGARLLRTAGGGNPVVLSPLSPLAVLLLLKPRSARPQPSWTACQKHPASRPGPPSPGGLSPTSGAAGPASASPSCATADDSATSLPSCPATASPRRSCGCATRDQPTAGPSGSTWPAAASTPSPSCPPPSGPRPARPKKGSMTPSSSTRAPKPATYGPQPAPGPRPRKCETRDVKTRHSPAKCGLPITASTRSPQTCQQRQVVLAHRGQGTQATASP